MREKKRYYEKGIQGYLQTPKKSIFRNLGKVPQRCFAFFLDKTEEKAVTHELVQNMRKAWGNCKKKVV